MIKPQNKKTSTDRQNSRYENSDIEEEESTKNRQDEQKLCTPSSEEKSDPLLARLLYNPITNRAK